MRSNRPRTAFPPTGWLALLWLAVCYAVPYLPPENLAGAVFGLLPPLFLAGPALAVAAVLFLVGLKRKASPLAPAAVALASIPLFGLPMPTLGEPSGQRDVRALSLNVHYASREMPKLLRYIRENDVDVVLLQENRGSRRSPARALHSSLGGWHLQEAGEVAIVSRWPLRNVREDQMRSVASRKILSADVMAPKPFRAVVTHWSSMQFSKGPKGVQYGVDRQLKDFAQTLSAAKESELPVILAGDFNNPPRHSLSRGLSRQFRNCFGEAGQGTGWTYPAGRPIIRIDHIYVSKAVEPVKSWVGPNLGSDHLPVLADVRFERS